MQLRILIEYDIILARSLTAGKALCLARACSTRSTAKKGMKLLLLVMFPIDITCTGT